MTFFGWLSGILCISGLMHLEDGRLLKGAVTLVVALALLTIASVAEHRRSRP
jgi:hypothetical protein